MNVRLPEPLVAQIDARRARKDLSRDAWVERAIRFALAFHPEDGTGVQPPPRDQPATPRSTP